MGQFSQFFVSLTPTQKNIYYVHMRMADYLSSNRS